MWQNTEHFENENEQLCETATLSRNIHTHTYTMNSTREEQFNHVRVVPFTSNFAYATLTRTAIVAQACSQLSRLTPKLTKAITIRHLGFFAIIKIKYNIDPNYKSLFTNFP